MTSFKSTAVFLGPSMPRTHARAIVNADFYPPAQMGDMYRVMSYGVSTIVLLDGVFHTVPSVWHRELLDALGEGIRVIGAASMGALRAAELYQFGMIGCGTIFEWYRDGKINGDDEVALLHGPVDTGFAALTEPLVNIRYTLACAVEDSCLTADDAGDLVAYAQTLHYHERTYHRLMDCPALSNWSNEQRRQLNGWLRAKRVDLKRKDATAALHAAAEPSTAGPAHHSAETQPRAYRWRVPPQHNLLWQKARMMHTRFVGTWGELTGEQILLMLEQDAELVSRLYPTLAQRRFALEWARQNGICTADYIPMTGGVAWNEHDYAAMLTRYERKWEQAHHVTRSDSWLRANGLTLSTYRAVLAEYALLDWIIEQSPALVGSSRSSEVDESRLGRFVLAWAYQNGVRCPADGDVAGAQGDRAPEQAAAHAEQLLADWIIRQGPAYFGMLWHVDLAVLRDLQVTGQLGAYISRSWPDGKPKSSLSERLDDR
jgi:hypothetical protein